METQQNPKKAMWLSLIPGLGQIYNKQKAKGYIFLGVTLVFLAYFFGLGLEELSKLLTLGTVRGQDNSLFILIRGAFHLIIIIVYLMFYALNIKDAGTVAKRINNGIRVPMTLKEMVNAIYENGFPYLLIIPSYIAMTFAIIFPVLVTLMIIVITLMCLVISLSRHVQKPMQHSRAIQQNYTEASSMLSVVSSALALGALMKKFTRKAKRGQK